MLYSETAREKFSERLAYLTLSDATGQPAHAMTTLLDDAENAPATNCLRILVLGSARVGKSAIVRRFLEGATDADSTAATSASTGVLHSTASLAAAGVDEPSVHVDQSDFDAVPYTPTIEDFHRVLYRVRSECFRVDLLDTAGTDPFPALRRLNILAGALSGPIRSDLFRCVLFRSDPIRSIANSYSYELLAS